MSDLTKTCKICKIVKQDNMFDKGRRYCKECRKQKNHNFYEKNKTYCKYDRQLTADYKNVNKMLANIKRTLDNNNINKILLRTRSPETS